MDVIIQAGSTCRVIIVEQPCHCLVSKFIDKIIDKRLEWRRQVKTEDPLRCCRDHTSQILYWIICIREASRGGPSSNAWWITWQNLQQKSHNNVISRFRKNSFFWSETLKFFSPGWWKSKAVVKDKPSCSRRSPTKSSKSTSWRSNPNGRLALDSSLDFSLGKIFDPSAYTYYI